MELSQEILDKPFWKIGELVENAYKKGDMHFVEQYIDYCLKTVEADDIVMEQYAAGNLEFVKKHFSTLLISSTKIAKQEYEKHNLGISGVFWQALDINTKSSMAYEVYRGNNTEKLKDFMRYEKKSPKKAGEVLCEALGDKDFAIALIKSGSGFEYEEEVSWTYPLHEGYSRTVTTPILCKALKMDDSESKMEIIQELLQAGVSPNCLISSSDEWKELKESTPALYVALKLDDVDLRRKVVIEMLRAGADPTLKHTLETGEGKFEYSCLDVNNGELRDIMREIGMEIPEVEYTEGASIVDFTAIEKYEFNDTYEVKINEETRIEPQQVKDKVKIGAFYRGKCYNSRNHACHGLQENFVGYCLMEKNGKMYLCSTEEMTVESSDGVGFEIRDSKFDTVGEVLYSLGISEYIEDEDVDIDYRSIESYTLINEDGTLSKEDTGFLSGMESVEATITRDDSESGEWPEIDEDDDIDAMGEKHLEASTIPYGRVDGSIEYVDGKVVVTVRGKSFDLSEMLKSKERSGDATLEQKEEKLTALEEQERKAKELEQMYIDTQEKGKIEQGE